MGTLDSLHAPSFAAEVGEEIGQGRYTGKNGDAVEEQ